MFIPTPPSTCSAPLSALVESVVFVTVNLSGVVTVPELERIVKAPTAVVTTFPDILTFPIVPTPVGLI